MATAAPRAPAPARAAAPARSSDGGGGAAARVKDARAEKDPRFKQLLEQIEENARRQRKHESAGKKAADAAKAAVAPGNERTAGAKAGQVDTMGAAEARPAETGGFLQMLRAEIDRVMPKTLDAADKFMEGGEAGAIQGAVRGEVATAKDAAAGGIDAAAKAAPDPSGVPAKETAPLPAEAVPGAAPVDSAAAVPAPKPDAAVAQDAKRQSADQQMKEAEVTPEQCGKANDPRFTAVMGAKGQLDQSVAAAPGKYRAGERQALAAGVAAATGDARGGLTQLRGVRTGASGKVATRQQQAKERDEQRRKVVADRIEAIYAKTKSSVEAKLATLETDVMAVFDAGIARALEAMKSWAGQQIDRFKDDRYSGIRGKVRWLADLFRPVHPEIKAILAQARARFTAQMDEVAVNVSSRVDRRLAEAKAEIAQGQGEVKKYVASLPADLKAAGQAAADAIQERFAELEQGVDAKKQDLAQKLAQRYKDAHDQADAALKKIEEENAGALRAFVDKLVEIVKLIVEFTGKLMALLRKGAATIKLILADPIGFLGNLISAIKAGVSGFLANIWTHLKKGFMGWLFGTLASAGVNVPADLSLPSIFKLVTEILGLTYARIRSKAVKLFGEKVVAAVEKVAEFVMAFIRGGAAALWEMVKEFLSDLKSMVIDGILDWIVTTIIKQAAMKLLSLFNPAGAFVQACLAIYNVVMFLIERAAQIVALIEAVINSVHAIATGAIGGAARWIENALGSTIPIVISFFARLIGLGGIADKIRGIITKVQAKLDQAIDSVLNKIIGKLKKLFGKDGGGKADTPEGRAGIAALDALNQKYADGADETALSADVAQVKTSHPVFKSLKLEASGKGLVYHFEMSPGQKKPAVKPGTCQIKLSRPGGFRKATKTDIRKLFPKLHEAVKNPRLKPDLDRRHIISSKTMIDHYEGTLHNKVKFDAAAKMLSGVGCPAKPTFKSPVKNAAIQEGAQGLVREFFNDVSNLWVGDASENRSIQEADDPPNVKEALAAFPAYVSGGKFDMIGHKDEMERKYWLK